MIFIGVYHLLRSIIVNDKNLSCNIAHDSLKWFVCGWKPVDLHDSNFSFLIGEHSDKIFSVYGNDYFMKHDGYKKQHTQVLKIYLPR